MSKITALKIQLKNQKRVSVFLDDEFAFGLDINVAADLKVGQNLLPEDIESLQQRELFEKARQTSLRFLSYRPRSMAEVRENLLRKGYTEALVDKAVDDLRTVNLLDDGKFAQYWIEQRETFKPRSHFALTQELRQKGVSQDVIDMALVEVDEVSSARRLAVKSVPRWRELPREQFHDKLGRFLQRRGFSYGIINQIINEMWQTASIKNSIDNDDATIEGD